MPNRVRKQSLEIRNQTLAELNRIYGSEWDAISKDVETVVDNMYLDGEDITAAQRKQYAKKNGRGKLVALLAATAITANGRAIKRINNGLDKVYKINVKDVASYVKSKTGISVYGTEPVVSKYTKRVYNRMRDSKLQNKTIAKTVDQMLWKGEGTKKIAKELERRYYVDNKSSAVRTTRTESTRVQARGRFDAMAETEKRGFEFEKIWRHGGMAKEPRDWHVAMNGERRKLNERFSNGLMMPGEVGAPAEETISCGCYLDEELIGY